VCACARARGGCWRQLSGIRPPELLEPAESLCLVC